MILIFFLYSREIFANNQYNGTSIEKFENGFIDQVDENNYFGQPRFNASCDDESLEAAAECEDRVYNLISKMYLIILIIYFIITNLKWLSTNNTS